ncbi:endonuclease MutS2 [Acaryochloris sp. CCMEE 5410]|uniref:endonuclease MutS2 n=1 Tax=Acaryochloris sp. CCMEE 5410 TaxID=310037 RepID=UPI0002484834|nr:endonuclease MutS2 [Acaryochloris sp. CCMEE 5410]KAI9135087.1 endonuclease MutS2 [Acaryochloris sp. CCMEE 5410]
MIVEKTLELLEWERLCQHLSTFAATKLGVAAAIELPIPTTVEGSETLLQQTQEVYDLETQLLTALTFEGIHDIRAALVRSQRQGILSGEELLQVATTLLGSRNLRRLINRYPELVSLNQLVADLRTYPELEQEIRHCIDEQGEVADRASEKLMVIRERQRQVRNDVQTILQRILQRKGAALQERLITQRSDRFVVPVKAPQKDAVPGIVHDASTSGATLYIEPKATVELNNRLRQLTRQEQAEAEAIRQALTEKVAEVQEDLDALLQIVTAVDLATARARYSYWLGANRPQFVNRAAETLTLRRLRHPLLVWQQHHEQGPEVVAIDVTIQPEIRVVAITGPNTGGKTVTLKTLGLATLMAKVGLFVPAQEPVELPWFDQVLADIGDEQSLQQSLSTFSGHIRRIQEIIAALTDQSLVLLDEVGAGTDPLEGSALAIALLRYLADQAQLTIATTHFGELKALKYTDARFENASVEFDDATLQPTYRLLWGIPGRSNALIIAQRLGLNEQVIAQALAQMDGETDDVNQVIAGLETERRQQETRAQAAAKLLQSTEQLHQQVAKKASDLKVREQKLRQQQEKAIQEEIRRAKQAIAQVIRDLQQQPKSAPAAQVATERLEKIASQRLPSRTKPKAPPPTGFQPQVGDRVRIPSIGQKADVIKITPTNELVVQFGMMKMTVKPTEVESLTGEKVTPPPKKTDSAPKKEDNTPNNSALMVRTSKNTLDIRGSRVADAEVVIEDAIAKAQGPLWIIHGHGTGKLRQGVQTYLSQHPLVSRYEFAEQADGGKGVTIAYCGV